MDDYIKIEKEDYHRIPIGTYIKWKKQDGEMSRGGTITAVTTKTKSAMAWVVTIFTKKTVVSWDNEVVYIIKTLFYDQLNTKIENLTNLVNFLAEQTNEKLAEIYENTGIEEPEEDIYSDFGVERMKYETGSLRAIKMRREMTIRERNMKKLQKSQSAFFKKPGNSKNAKNGKISVRPRGRPKKRDIIINFTK